MPFSLRWLPPIAYALQWVSFSVFGHQGADAADAVTVAVEVQLDKDGEWKI